MAMLGLGLFPPILWYFYLILKLMTPQAMQLGHILELTSKELL